MTIPVSLALFAIALVAVVGLIAWACERQRAKYEQRRAEDWKRLAQTVSEGYQVSRSNDARTISQRINKSRRMAYKTEDGEP